MPSFEIVELDKAGKPRPFPVGVFPDGTTAASIIKSLSAQYPEKKFQPRPLKDETNDWKAREQRRFDEQVYQPLGLDLTPIKDHFAHKALKTPANVAFTPDAAHGKVDKQVSIHIRTYINRFYPNLSIEEKRKAVWDYCGEKFGDEMELAVTQEEIRHVYENGPSSCMSDEASNWSGLNGHHPAEVYASEDFAVAYIRNDAGRITARAVVAKQLKIFGRIYGDIDKLRIAMEQNGYKEADSYTNWIGLKLLKIESDEGYVCPYLDFASYVQVEGDYLVVSRNGMCADNTGGECFTGDYDYDDDY